jgi:hypothetical protein
MEASEARHRRVDIGFFGTQVLSVRMTEAAYDELREALSGAEGRTWKQVETDEALFSIDLDKVVYVRIERERDHIGF